jgi:protein-S-isoprenylcysteine O-methyltransferase Ste14
VGSLPLLLAAPAFLLIINQTYIPYEEAKLRRIFGSSYEQ